METSPTELQRWNIVLVQLLVANYNKNVKTTLRDHIAYQAANYTSNELNISTQIEHDPVVYTTTCEKLAI